MEKWKEICVTNLTSSWYSCPYVINFTIRKTKTQQALQAADIAAPALQFLQAEKWKLVCINRPSKLLI